MQTQPFCLYVPKNVQKQLCAIQKMYPMNCPLVDRSASGSIADSGFQSALHSLEECSPSPAATVMGEEADIV